MFKVCLPISDLLETATLLTVGLTQDADVLELRRPARPAYLPDKPLVFHWGLGLVQQGFVSTFKREGVGSFLRQYNIDLFSFDLGPACRRSQFILPLSRTLKPEEILAVAASSLEEVRRDYSGQLAVENYNYYPTGLYDHVCRPDFISRFLEKFQLGLVLDLAHAAITAANLDISLERYLAELPLNKVVEIHLSRPYFHPKIAVDAHAAPGNEDFRFLLSVLQRLPGPESVLVSIEYYQDLHLMIDQYRALRELRSKFHQSRLTERRTFCLNQD